MSESEYIREKLPLIDRVISGAEARIETSTGIKLKLGILEVESVDDADNQMLKVAMQACEIWRISYHELLEKCQKRDMATRRKALVVVLKKRFEKATWKRIAHVVGQGDHSSAMHSYETGLEHIEVHDEMMMRYYLPIKQLIDETPKTVQAEAEAQDA